MKHYMTQTPKKSAPKKKADQYNDPTHNYLHYWDGREYEHAAEEIAIRKLLKKKHFETATDVGGGYGRLCLLLEDFADDVTGDASFAGSKSRICRDCQGIEP
jgi:hypothetical protein